MFYIYKVSVNSSKTLNEIYNNLMINTETNVSVKMWTTIHLYKLVEHKYFYGSVSKNRFKIQKIINYRNSFLPVIYGKFCKKDDGIQVKISMRLNRFTLLFLALWYFIILYFLSLFSKFNYQMLYVLLFGLIPFLFIIFGFYPEAKKASYKLNTILK